MKRRFQDLAEKLGRGPRDLAEWEQTLNEQFDSAKRLSDFIGMIVRFAFAELAVIFFLRRMLSSENPVDGGVYGFCFATAFGLSVVFGGKIFALVLTYEWRDAIKTTHPLARTIFTALAIINAVFLWYGITRLVWELAGSSSVLAGS